MRWACLSPKSPAACLSSKSRAAEEKQLVSNVLFVRFPQGHLLGKDVYAGEEDEEGTGKGRVSAEF